MKNLSIVLTLFLSLNTNSFAENQKVKVSEGKVIQIYDGDTLSISTTQGETKVLRLAYIDSPELNQNFGDRAKRNLEKLLLDKKIKFNATIFFIFIPLIYSNNIFVFFYKSIKKSIFML